MPKNKNEMVLYPGDMIKCVMDEYAWVTLLILSREKDSIYRRRDTGQEIVSAQYRVQVVASSPLNAGEGFISETIGHVYSHSFPLDADDEMWHDEDVTVWRAQK